MVMHHHPALKTRRTIGGAELLASRSAVDAVFVLLVEIEALGVGGLADVGAVLSLFGGAFVTGDNAVVKRLTGGIIAACTTTFPAVIQRCAIPACLLRPGIFAVAADCRMSTLG